MTSENYPNGLNPILADFSISLYDIIHSNEIDKVIKNCSKKEKKILETLLRETKEWKPLDFNLWMMSPVISECPRLIIDVLAYMVTNTEKKAYTPKELESIEKKHTK